MTRGTVPAPYREKAQYEVFQQVERNFNAYDFDDVHFYAVPRSDTEAGKTQPLPSTVNAPIHPCIYVLFVFIRSSYIQGADGGVTEVYVHT